MKRKSKKIIILGLALIFVLASVICCCIPQPVQANEDVPECHQTARQTDDSRHHKSEECHCQDIVSISVEKMNNNIELARILCDLYPSAYQTFDSFVPAVTANQAPPENLACAIPRSLQNSILRI